MNMSDIARNIKLLRQKQGMTQAELAERLHVTRQTVSNWERGAAYPDIPMLMEMAKTCDVDINQLLFLESRKQGKVKWKPISAKFIIGSLISYFIIFYIGGAYIGVPLFSKLIGGGIEERFLYYIYWGLLVLAGYIAVCIVWVSEYINELLRGVDVKEDNGLI